MKARRFIPLLLACALVSGCAARLAATDTETLQRRLAQDFPPGSPAQAMIEALIAVGYDERGGPAYTAEDALPTCLSRRYSGRLQLAGRQVLNVCYAADDAGNLTRVEVTKTRLSI